jgi:hypothetical protein
LFDDRGKSADDEDQVADNIDTEGPVDGLVTAEVGIGDEGTEERHGVLPELVESGEASRGLLTHAEDTGLGGAAAGKATAFGKGLLNVVGDYWSSQFRIQR